LNEKLFPFQGRKLLQLQEQADLAYGPGHKPALVLYIKPKLHGTAVESAWGFLPWLIGQEFHGEALALQFLSGAEERR
jgi:hypothetical protein